ncbi:MAG TPA: phosphodiester glycosidase family protein [Gemmatimonadales bacterium]|nr:phosphodiester glycosidase family protein [Gemmatimonadales bacterium]
MHLIRTTLSGLAVTALLLTAAGQPAEVSGSGRRAGQSLSILHEGRWIRWWQSDRAPDTWTAPHPAVNAALAWRRVGDGVEWSELRLAGDGISLRVRVIAVRIDPARVRLRLESSWTGSGRPDWSVERADDSALVSFNAGQFSHGTPWGWVVSRGRQLQSPGRGPLSVGVAVDSSGSLRWIHPEQLTDHLNRRGVVEGFQSYPRLLDHGRVPEPLRLEGSGVDLRHRDARLALGQGADGAILVALTRYDGIGGVLDFVPFGLTTPEMAAVMGAIGARDAVMLDGGISSQLLIRDGAEVHRWRGLRGVPVGLVVTARKE